MPVTLQNDVDSATLATALGAAPGAGDTIIINQFNTTFAATALAVDLAKITFGAGWSGNINTLLSFECDQTNTGLVECRFSGSVLNIGSSIKTKELYQVIIAPARDGTVNLQTCTAQLLRMLKGNGICADDCIATDVWMTDGTLKLSGGATPETCAAVNMQGGSLDVQRIVTALTAAGSSRVSLNNSVGSIGTLDFAGDEFTWLQGNVSTMLRARKGLINMAKVKRPVTVADYQLGADVEIILPPTSVMANPFTNAAKFVGGTPTFYAS